jgi:hypothetical protein
MLEKLHDRFRSRVDVELFIDALCVGPHGSHADPHLRSDLFIRSPLARLSSTCCSRSESRASSIVAGRGFWNEATTFAGDLAGHGRAAFMDFTDRIEQFGGRMPLSR